VLLGVVTSDLRLSRACSLSLVISCRL
jgi:hypothetical protein